MGCVHYERAAAVAQLEKDELTVEREEYYNVNLKLISLISSSDEYASFFNSLVPHLESIIVHHDTFNSRECSSHANSFNSIKSDFQDINLSIVGAIEEIDKEIKEKDKIISQRGLSCYSCREAAAKKAVADTTGIVI